MQQTEITEANKHLDKLKKGLPKLKELSVINYI